VSSSSKRAYQQQFRKWKFPSKHNPAYKNDHLVARVKELWERNLPQTEMLRILTEEDGFDIKDRELTRVRAINRWLLRMPNGTQPPVIDNAAPPPADDPPMSQALPSDTVPPEHLALQQLAEVSGIIWTDKAQPKRKRGARTSRGPTAESSGQQQPRFPSETTIDEARLILGLDTESYRETRAAFVKICEQTDIVKKTLAGPERWEAAKEQLIREISQLQTAMWVNKDNGDNKKLALEIICTDVTKRMRVAEHRMTIAEAKNLLGVNPEQIRGMRLSLTRLLREDRVTTKSEAGQEHWDDLKRRWAMGSDVIQAILLSGEADPANQDKAKALEVLARDVIKRLRDDDRYVQRDRTKSKPSPQGKKKAALKPVTKAGPKRTPASRITRQLPSPQASQLDIGEMDAANFDHTSQVGQLPRLDLVPTTPDGSGQVTLGLSSQDTGLQSSPDGLVHHASARLMPSSVLASQAGLPLDPQLGSALLLTADGQSAFVDQQYVEQFAAAQAAQVFHAHAVPPPPTAQRTSTVAIYLRLHGSSTFVTATNLWIATLNSHSLQELRHIAAEKWPGAICLRVEGVLKDGKGSEVPLQIDEDQELAAYLAHLQGVTPTFNVQLVPGWKTG
jgi:hypothetical protein